MLINDGVHGIHPSVYLFVVLLFHKVTPGNILIIYRGDGMEEGDGPPLFLTTMTIALSYHSLEE